jgi:DNA-binding response OmpR family regulator
MIKILLLEDDELFAFSLVDYIEEFTSYQITHVKSSNEFLVTNYDNPYDLYLLDINLPDMNGLELLKELRQSGDNTPTIYLTSYKDKESLKTGFETGADDFLTKPFDMDELILRINSLMKRCNKVSSIRLGNVEIDFETKSVKKDQKDVKVGLKVLELLELFYQNNNSIVSKDMIIDKLWGSSDNYSDGSLRVYVNNIKKLFDDESVFKITNIKNIGYKIEY